MSSPGDFVYFVYGVPNDFKPYQIVTQEGRTFGVPVTTQTYGGGRWEFATFVTIIIVVNRLDFENIDKQLGNMEREVQRMIFQYQPDDIPGIDHVEYITHDRIYDYDTGYAQTRWESRTLIQVYFNRVNVDL